MSDWEAQKYPGEDRFNVLDHGYVRLVDHMGSDLSIVRAARVSYDAAWRAGEDEKSDKKLINYLWKNNHTTPFEAATVTFEVYAPIFVFRQWHRHRTQSYNELSARYRQLPEVYYVPQPEAVGVQSASNKQGRDTTSNDDELLTRREKQILRQAEHARVGFELYRELIEDGWPKELARIHLGFATYSHMFATMNLLNCFKFLGLRVHNHAQYEVRVYAQAMLDLIRPVYPVSVAAFESTLVR